LRQIAYASSHLLSVSFFSRKASNKPTLSANRSADFIVTQPRLPCYKLGIRFNRPEIVRLFLRSKRTGLYLRVLREGDVGEGDAISFIEKQETGITITGIVSLYSTDAHNLELLRRAIQVPALPQSWKDYFRKRLPDLDS
jgi:MOSC domain-containing protein YiiM